MPAAEALIEPRARAAAADAAPAPFAALFAWGLLVWVDVALKVLGFDRFYRMVRAWPCLGATPDGERLRRARLTCAAVDRARTYYFKRAWCLQSAAAAVCFLRLRGIPAELVIAVRKIPFSAHAWAELDGVALNNRQEGMETLYRVITRC
jgi:hypothetical protein